MQPLKWFFDIIKQTKRSFILSHVCSYHTFEHIANLKKIAQHRDNANILHQHEKLSILSHISVFCREFLFVLYIFLPIFFARVFHFFRYQFVRRQTNKKQQEQQQQWMIKYYFVEKWYHRLLIISVVAFVFFVAVCYFWLTIFYLSSVNERWALNLCT